MADNRPEELVRLDAYGSWGTMRQRYTGTFSEDGSTITGGWEKSIDGGDWKHDFVLIYHRAG